jgi:hypothetical protein
MRPGDATGKKTRRDFLEFQLRVSFGNRKSLPVEFLFEL